MTNLQKFQLWFSIVPTLSTAFSAFVTMSDLKRHNGSRLQWVEFISIFFGFGLLASFIIYLIPDGWSFVELVIGTLVMAVGNYLLVRLQMKLADQ